MRTWYLISQARKRAKGKNINFRLTSVAQKRLCLSSLIILLFSDVPMPLPSWFRKLPVIKERPHRISAAFSFIFLIHNNSALDWSIIRMKCSRSKN